MCGISGLVDLSGKNAEKSKIEKISSCLNHRGPDGNGLWMLENIALAHTRLAILDLSKSANQPMISKNQMYSLTYNGELYNYQELRKQLKQKDYQFSTNSDSEVILNSLIEWGTDALLKFNGIFAFGFYNNFNKTLLMARDRYGVKPLYYLSTQNYFAFASEQKSLLNVDKFEKNLDLETLYEYMTFQNIFTNNTFIKNIKLLEPGHYLKVPIRQFTEIKPVQYWDFLFEEIDHQSESDFLEEFKRIFEISVKSQLMGDVEIGAYLSGGLDSSSIVAIASKNRNLKTFTVGFENPDIKFKGVAHDESLAARKISEALKTEHFEYSLKPQDMENSLLHLVFSLEEPRIGQSYPNYYAAKLASQHVKVVLSGAGGDELFGGYPWRYFRQNKSNSFSEYIDQYYLYWQRLLPNSELKKLFKPVANAVKSVWTRDIFEGVFKNLNYEPNNSIDFINHAMYFEAKTFLHSLLVLEDKLSMAFGLESRIPFLDNDLVNFAMKLPVKYKLKNLQQNIRIDENTTSNKTNEFFRQTNDGKYLLRQALPDLVPEFVKNEVKRGFASPDLIWFRRENKEYIENSILNKRNKMYNIFDYNIVKQHVDDYFNEKSNNRLLIWSFIYLNTLLDEF